MMYYDGIDRELADGVFIANLSIAVRRHNDKKSLDALLDKALLRPRLDAAWLYFRAVVTFGGGCFGKQA
jgi:hypothetical protein